jgi:sugar phosphate isomerase/epimerase
MTLPQRRPYLSALLTSLPSDFASSIRTLRTLGFTHVDLVALADRPDEHLEVLAESGLIVSCGALGRNLPEGCTLDTLSVQDRRRALEEMQRQIADIAHLGGTCAYIVPTKDASVAAVARFSEACGLLAEYAGGRMVRLSIEHFPGTALPSAAAVLDFVDRVGQPNLGLLLDVGHCLLSREDAAAVVRRARDRLFYVHLDDNDGVADLHWPLLAGRLTEESLRATLAALREQGYAGGMALELRAENAEPAEALRKGRELLARLLQSPS